MDSTQTYKWIKSVMESCYTLKQLDNCVPLVNSFYERYNLGTESNLLIKYKHELTNKIWNANQQINK